MPTNRRKFIQQAALMGGALLTSKSLFASNILPVDNNEEKLVILHTNDVHSRLEPFPMDESKNAGLGGVAARADLIRRIRSVEENVLLLDSGDIFQGTPYFNFYKGEPEIKAMSMMQYDASTLGNHDFDGGMENFATQQKHATFPFINCNYDFTGTPLEGKTIPYKIIQKGKIKVGILGVGVELHGLVPEKLYGNTKYLDPIQKANETAALLHKKGCDMIICLSHLGDKYTDNKVSDEVLAQSCHDIDLIIGGHTHRLFEKPRVYTNMKGNETIVNQVGWAGMYLGRLDYNFSVGKNKKLQHSHKVIVHGKTIE